MADSRHVIQIQGAVSGGGGGAPMGPGMGGPPSAPSGGPQQIQNPNLNLMAKHLREIAAGSSGLGGTLKSSLKATGIQFSLAGVLKQSQLFTGMIGSIFQILGAGIDIILAAFMPILVPAIRLIASMLPLLRIAVDKTLGAVVRWLVKLVEFVTGQALKDKVSEGVEGIASALGADGELAKNTGKTAGNLAPVIIGGALATGLALSPVGKFLKIGGGISKVMGGVTGAVKGIGKVSGVTTFFKSTKFGQTISKGVASGFSKAKGLIGGIGKAVTGGLGKVFGKIPGVKAIAKLGGKVGAKGLIPGLSSAIIAGETAFAAVKNYKDARKQGAGMWKSLGLAGAGASMGLGAAALSLVAPMAGMAAQEGGTMASNLMMNAAVGTNRGVMEGTMTGSVVNIINNVNGVTESSMQQRMDEAQGDNTFETQNNTVYPGP